MTDPKPAAGPSMPPLTALAVANYRSLREFIVPLAGLNVVTGPNGSGKSSGYRALRLLADTAQGRAIPSLAREGGLASTLWAGPERFSRAMLAGEVPVQPLTRKGSGLAQARLRLRGFRLRHRPGPADRLGFGLRPRSGDQARMPVERRHAAGPRRCWSSGTVRRSARATRLAAGAVCRSRSPRSTAC